MASGFRNPAGPVILYGVLTSWVLGLIQFSAPEGRSDGLCQQIPCEDDSYIFRAASCFFDCQPRRLLLQHTLCFFPGILPQLIQYVAERW